MRGGTRRVRPASPPECRPLATARQRPVARWLRYLGAWPRARRRERPPAFSWADYALPCTSTYVHAIGKQNHVPPGIAEPSPLAHLAAGQPRIRGGAIVDSELGSTRTRRARDGR